MCTRGDGVPGDVAEALRALESALDFINGPLTGDLPAGASGEALAALGRVGGKLAAARARVLSRFDATRGHDRDGYGSSASWMAAMNRVTRKSARADVRQMRVLGRHPVIAEALSRGDISESWAVQLAAWTRKLPAELRGSIDKLLVDTAAAGAELEDLEVVARAAYERWRQQQPEPDEPDDGFDERYLKVDTTIDGAGRVNGDLTPECTAALEAVLDALGKKEGPEDTRTEPQRLHDALQLACTLLLRAKMTPDRAGADTRVDAVIALAQLRSMPGGTELENTWLAAVAGQHAHLAGKDAEAAACDAIITPVVIGHPDLTIVDQIIDIVLGHLDAATDADATRRPKAPSSKAPSSKALSPEAWRALRFAIARLAVDLVSGPTGLAATLRQGLLDEPYNSKPVVLDVGLSDQVPAHIRRAVQLRARHCEWPGCRKRPVYCDLHHLVHQADGGATSLANCVLLCQFHHDVCIHRWGWRLVLHPDATTTAYGPQGQVIRSHGPPDSRAA